MWNTAQIFPNMCCINLILNDGLCGGCVQYQGDGMNCWSPSSERTSPSPIELGLTTPFQLLAQGTNGVYARRRMWSRRNGETLWLRQPTPMASRWPNIFEWNLFKTLGSIEPADRLSHRRTMVLVYVYLHLGDFRANVGNYIFQYTWSICIWNQVNFAFRTCQLWECFGPTNCCWNLLKPFEAYKPMVCFLPVVLTHVLFADVPFLICLDPPIRGQLSAQGNLVFSKSEGHSPWRRSFTNLTDDSSVHNLWAQKCSLEDEDHEG